MFFLLFCRFVEKEEIERPELLLVVGCIGLLVNLVGLVLLYGKNISDFFLKNNLWLT